MNSEQGPTLSVGNYNITSGTGGFLISLVGDLGQREWLATAADPQIAMRIVEGLVLVEMKRFYHPESTPVMKGSGQSAPATGESEKKPLPPFLKRGVEDSQDQS